MTYNYDLCQFDWSWCLNYRLDLCNHTVFFIWFGWKNCWQMAMRMKKDDGVEEKVSNFEETELEDIKEEIFQESSGRTFQTCSSSSLARMALALGSRQLGNRQLGSKGSWLRLLATGISANGHITLGTDWVCWRNFHWKTVRKGPHFLRETFSTI